ncbi:MAG TPA: folate-binding protein [Opitutaceae bacterium]
MPVSWLRVTGEDALAFLQGQFTQELRSPAAAPVAYGLWLNQKGRVLADSFALRVSPREVWLLSYAAPAAVIRERLEAYVIADDVTVEDVSGGWRGVAIVGAEATEWLTARLGALPAAGEFARTEAGFLFRGRREAGESWEWLVPGGAPFRPDLADLPELAAEEMARRRILARIPEIPTDVGPADLPNEAGLEAVAISYTKGCYLGQEVMARLKAMGQVRRRLLGISGQGPAPAAPAPLFQAGRKVGELRSVVPVQPGLGGGSVGLAMLTMMGLDSQAPLTLAPDGPEAFTLLDQP